jgi:antitoxin component YwqK of YwqJK toxin-antitoxin module
LITPRSVQQVKDAVRIEEVLGEFLDLKRNGVWTSYTEQGGVQSRNDYVDGVLQVQSIVFRPNGAVYYQGEHRNGKQVGAWKFYDEQGNLAKTVEYDTLGNIVGQP